MAYLWVLCLVVVLLIVGAKICSKHALVEQNRVEKRKRGDGRITSEGGHGRLEGQQKDKQKGRSEGRRVSFAGRKQHVEGAYCSENLSELVVMAGGKPTAVLVRYTEFGWTLKHAYPGIDPTHWQTYSTVKSEVS